MTKALFAAGNAITITDDGGVDVSNLTTADVLMLVQVLLHV